MRVSHDRSYIAAFSVTNDGRDYRTSTDTAFGMGQQCILDGRNGSTVVWYRHVGLRN
jgi:hypothetical protein